MKIIFCLRQRWCVLRQKFQIGNLIQLIWSKFEFPVIKNDPIRNQIVILND